jgi:hypothetical protein
MANEIIFSGIGDLTVTEAITNAYLLLLADRQALPQHPALFYAGSIGAAVGASSNTLKVPHIGLMGYDLAASTSDGSAVANTALADGSTTIAVARYSKSYEASDLARIAAGGLINSEAMAMDAVMTGALTLTNLIANLVDDFSSTVGTSGSDATFSNFLDAITKLEIAKVSPPYMVVLHPVQWGDIRKDLGINAGGAVQWTPAAAEAINTKGIGYQGELAGVSVFTSAYVPTANAGADRAGGMFGRGAILWADGSPPFDADLPQMLIGGKVLFEKVRTGKSGLTAYVMHQYLGAAEGIDACGVSIITDA